MHNRDNGRCYEGVLRSAWDFLLARTGPHTCYAGLRHLVKSPPSLGAWPTATQVAHALTGMFAPLPVGLFFAWHSRTSYRVARTTSTTAHICRKWQTRFGKSETIYEMSSLGDIRVGGSRPPAGDVRVRLTGLAACVHTLLLHEGRRREADVVSYGRQYVGWFKTTPTQAASLVEEGRVDSGGAHALHFCRKCGVSRTVFGPTRPVCARCGGRVAVSSLVCERTVTPPSYGKVKKVVGPDGWTTIVKQGRSASPISTRSEPTKVSPTLPTLRRAYSVLEPNPGAVSGYKAALLRSRPQVRPAKRPNVQVPRDPLFAVYVRKGCTDGSPSVIRDMPRQAPVRGARIVKVPVVARCAKRGEEVASVRTGDIKVLRRSDKNALYSGWARMSSGEVLERPFVKLPVVPGLRTVSVRPPKGEVLQAASTAGRGRTRCPTKALPKDKGIVKSPSIIEKEVGTSRFFTQTPNFPGQKWVAIKGNVRYYPVVVGDEEVEAYSVKEPVLEVATSSVPVGLDNSGVVGEVPVDNGSDSLPTKEEVLLELDEIEEEINNLLDSDDEKSDESLEGLLEDVVECVELKHSLPIKKRSFELKKDNIRAGERGNVVDSLDTAMQIVELSQEKENVRRNYIASGRPELPSYIPKRGDGGPNVDTVLRVMGNERHTNVGLINNKAARDASPPLFWGDVSSDSGKSSTSSSSAKKRRRAAARKAGLKPTPVVPDASGSPIVELTLEQRCKRPLTLLPEVVSVLEQERKINPSVHRFGKWAPWAVLWAHHKCGLISSEEKLMRTRISKGLSPRANVQEVSGLYDPGCGNKFPSRKRFLETVAPFRYKEGPEGSCRFCFCLECPSVNGAKGGASVLNPAVNELLSLQGVVPDTRRDKSVVSADNQLLRGKLEKGVRGTYLTAIHKKEMNGYCYANLFREVAFLKSFYLSDKRVREITRTLGPYPLCVDISCVLEEMGFDPNPVIHINGDARSVFDASGNRVQVIGHFTASNFYFKMNLLDNPTMALGGIGNTDESSTEAGHIDVILPQLRATVIDQISKSRISECMYARELEQQCLRVEKEKEMFIKGLPRVTIPYFLESADRSKLASAFPELNLDFKPSKFSQHTMAACVRLCFNEVYASKFRETDYIDVGGDIVYHSMRGHENVHTCNPLADFKDASRCAKRMQTWATAVPGTAKAACSVAAPLRCCYKRAEECDSEAPVVTAVEVYDISVHVMAEILIKKKAHVAYVTMVLPGELLSMSDGSCYGSALGVEISMRGEDISFNYNGGLGYTHKRSTMMSWILNPCFVTGGCMFTVEMISNRLGVSEITITRASYYPPVNCTLTVAVPMIERDMTVLYLPDYSLDTGLFDFNRKECIKVDRRFFSEGLVYVMNNCVSVSDKHLEWVCTWLRQNKSRVVISGRVIHNNVYLPEKLVSKVAALLLVVGVKSRITSSKYAKGLVRAYDTNDSMFYQLWTRIKESVISLGRTIAEAIIKFIEYLFPLFKGLNSGEIDDLYKPIANFDYKSIPVIIDQGNMEEWAGTVEAQAIEDFYKRNQKRFVEKTVREIAGVTEILESKITTPVQLKVEKGEVKVHGSISSSKVLESLHRSEDPFRPPKGGLLGGNRPFSVCVSLLEKLKSLASDAKTRVASWCKDLLARFKVAFSSLVEGKPIKFMLDQLTKMKGYLGNKCDQVLKSVSRMLAVYKDSTRWDVAFFVTKGAVSMVSEFLLDVVAGKPVFLTMVKVSLKYMFACWQVDRLRFDGTSTGVDDSFEMLQLITDFVWEGLNGYGIRITLPRVVIFSMVRSICAVKIAKLFSDKSVEAGRVSCNMVLDEVVNVVRRMTNRVCDHLTSQISLFICDLIDQPNIKGRVNKFVDEVVARKSGDVKEAVFSTVRGAGLACKAKVTNTFRVPEVISRYFRSMPADLSVGEDVAPNEGPGAESASVDDEVYNVGEFFDVASQLSAVDSFIEIYQSAYDDSILSLMREEGYGSELELADEPGLRGGGLDEAFLNISKTSLLALESLRRFLRISFNTMKRLLAVLFAYLSRRFVRVLRSKYCESRPVVAPFDSWVCDTKCRGAVAKRDGYKFDILATDLPRLIVIPTIMRVLRLERTSLVRFPLWEMTERELPNITYHDSRYFITDGVDSDLEIKTVDLEVEDHPVTLISGDVRDIENDLLAITLLINGVPKFEKWHQFLNFLKEREDGFYVMDGSTIGLKGGSVKKVILESALLYLIEDFLCDKFVNRSLFYGASFLLRPRSWLLVRAVKAIIERLGRIKANFIAAKEKRRTAKSKPYEQVILPNEYSPVKTRDIAAALNGIRDVAKNPVAACFPNSVIIVQNDEEEEKEIEKGKIEKEGIVLSSAQKSTKGKEVLDSGDHAESSSHVPHCESFIGDGDLPISGRALDRVINSAVSEASLLTEVPTTDELKGTVNEIFESSEEVNPLVTKVAKSKELKFSLYCKSLMGNLVPPLAPECTEDGTINARNEYLYLKKQDVYNILYDVTLASTQLEEFGEYELSDSAQNSNLIIYDKVKKKFCGKRADSHFLEYNDKLDSDLYCACGKNYCTFSQALQSTARFIVSHEQMAVFYSDKMLMPLTAGAYIYSPIVVKAIKVVETPPGGGKTTEIVCLITSMLRRKAKFLCCTANKNSCTEIRRRVACRYLNLRPLDKKGLLSICKVLNDCVRTMDSFLMAGEERAVAVLLLDEVFMVHSGQVLNIFSRVNCERIIAYGDSNQIGFISRTDHALNKYGHIGNMIPDFCQEYRTISYRCPRDVCRLLSIIYGREIYNPYYKEKSSVSLTEISCLEDVPLVNGVKYLVQTQAEKLELTKRVKFNSAIEKRYYPQTVHEAQGDTHEKVYLVRTKANDDEPFVSDAHNVVAISRHTHSFVYFVIRSKADDIMSTMIKKCVEIQELDECYVDKSPENVVDVEEDISTTRENDHVDKHSPVGSAPYSAIIEFISEVVPGSTSVLLGDMSEALNTSEFNSDASGVTISAGKVVPATREQRVWRN
uniref:Polyprotein 1a n=1 Tax=Persimmon virus B TaxID=1493829 RepID=A0A0A8JCA3_9CLOS|nr:polyprotein 1a [Persimmon virus B]